MAGPRRMHDVAPRDLLDRTVFFIAFFAGVIGSILIKALGGHPFWAAGYAAAVLFAYAILAWAGGRVKLEPETIGDNCYYLGFLFTLSSLAYTLYQMADPSLNGGRPVDIPDVISGFGVALSSTIVGVFLRVLLMQLRPDFIAKDREVRADINRSFADFRKNMAGMLSQMKAFSAESVQMASERDGRIRQATEIHLQQHQAALRESTEALAKSMTAAFSEAMNEIVKEVSNANKAHQSQMKSIMDELADLKDRLIEQEIESFEQISARRRVLMAEDEEHQKKIAAQKEATELQIKATRRAADALNKRIVPALEGFKDRLDALPSEPQQASLSQRLSEEVPAVGDAEAPSQGGEGLLNNPWSVKDG